MKINRNGRSSLRPFLLLASLAPGFMSDDDHAALLQMDF